MKGTTILGGEFQRHKIGTVPRGLLVRPMLAQIKKSLFDILKSRVSGSCFLDLFAGSGSVGLEALSRGARKVVFIDADPRCKRWIEDTLGKVALKGRDLIPIGENKVYRADVLDGLDWLHERYDLIFSGAPYVDRSKRPVYFVQHLLRVIERDGILAGDGWFIAQHHAKESFSAPAGWVFFRQERYGDTNLSFFRHD